MVLSKLKVKFAWEWLWIQILWVSAGEFQYLSTFRTHNKVGLSQQIIVWVLWKFMKPSLKNCFQITFLIKPYQIWSAKLWEPTLYHQKPWKYLPVFKLKSKVSHFETMLKSWPRLLWLSSNPYFKQILNFYNFYLKCFGVEEKVLLRTDQCLSKNLHQYHLSTRGFDMFLFKHRKQVCKL